MQVWEKVLGITQGLTLEVLPLSREIVSRVFLKKD
jgi:hypothetical protein